MEETTTSPSRLFTALAIGAGVGILCVALNVVITFLNAPIYQAVVNEGKAVTGNTYAVFGLACLGLFIQVLACFLTGFIVGKATIQRQLGFYAAVVTSAIVYLASFAVRYIPNYPGNLTSSTSVSAGMATGGIITVIVFLIIWGLVGGLIGLWGARISTRKHPAYAGQPHE
ncbi:hypothetical protein KSF_045540 [Reticulibacter mediterranei]|uniref:Uncharacterized protein n=1 Tax=Reticulibacter mediterranei TaxID=2778369 RepID=A0A8J3ISI8_9CHLR|nr:hypothetical protein KSF_045540 [Reticulibacter mediterranei]